MASYEHLKCVKTVWWLRDEISFASVEKKSWLRPCRPCCMQWLFFNEATTGRRLRPGALLIIYINIVRGAKHLWGESSMGRNIYEAKCPSMGRNVHGAKNPLTPRCVCGHRCGLRSECCRIVPMQTVVNAENVRKKFF